MSALQELKEIGIGLVKITLGMIILLAALIALDILVYISATSSTFGDKVASAYSIGYDQAYLETYNVGYHRTYGEAYNKGLEKGYEIGQELATKEGAVARVELRNPTYNELREFLDRDDTDSNPYVGGEYVCFHFAAELNNNAEASGIRAGYVRLFAKEWGHAAVAFETVDRGLVFIEPQSDKEVELVIGEPYPWWQVGANRPMSYNDAITDIQIIW